MRSMRLARRIQVDTRGPQPARRPDVAVPAKVTALDRGPFELDACSAELRSAARCSRAAISWAAVRCR